MVFGMTEWTWLIEPKTGGLRFNINNHDGRANYCVPFDPRAAGVGVDARYQARPVACNVAFLAANLGTLDPRIRKAFHGWSKKLAKDDPERLNSFINEPQIGGAS